MGSLMSGWDSPVPDPKSMTHKRNWSFTKGEIEAYWRLKKKVEEEHLRDISGPSDCSKEDTSEESGSKFQRSSSLPLANTKEGFMGMNTETNFDNLMNKNGWWTRSNWAFLNEPPESEEHSNTYAAQFHIANLATSKENANNAGISS